MNSNALADAVLAVLTPIHSRSYRNKSPQSPTYPIVVFSLDSSVMNDPSTDYYLNVDVFDDPNVSARAIETLADSIQDALDDLIISNSSLNTHIAIEQRQYIPNQELVTAQMINLRFIARTYFK